MIEGEIRELIRDELSKAGIMPVNHLHQWVHDWARFAAVDGSGQR